MNWDDVKHSVQFQRLRKFCESRSRSECGDGDGGASRSETAPVTVFMTYGDTRFAKSRKRICYEAIVSQRFDLVLMFAPEDLPRSFVEKHIDFLRRSPRGGGYYIWKPMLMYLVYAVLPPESVVFFADAGCKFTGDPQPWIDRARASVHGITLFELNHKIRCWTKTDTFIEMGISPDVGHNNQVVGGIQLWVKRPAVNEEILREWVRWSQVYHIIDDSPSIAANHPEFVENRHDQTVISLLRVKYDVATIPDETWPVAAAKVLAAARIRE